MAAPKQLIEPEITDRQAEIAYDTVKTNPERFGVEGLKARRKWGRYISKPGIAPVAVTEMVMTLELCDKHIAYAEKILNDEAIRVDEPKLWLANQKMLLEAIGLRAKIIKETLVIGEKMKEVKAVKGQNAPPNFAVQVNVGDKAEGKSIPVEVIERKNGALIPGNES